MSRSARVWKSWNSLPVVLALLCSACTQMPAVVQDRDLIVRRTTTKPFDEVIADLDFSITQHNFRITGRNTIGAGLRERGYADFPDIEVIHFCSLELAREVLLIDPGFVAQMPCRITIHTLPARTVVSVILLPEDHPDARVRAFAIHMNTTLQEVLADVVPDPR